MMRNTKLQLIQQEKKSEIPSQRKPEDYTETGWKEGKKQQRRAGEEEVPRPAAARQRRKPGPTAKQRPESSGRHMPSCSQSVKEPACIKQKLRGYAGEASTVPDSGAPRETNIVPAHIKFTA